MNQLNKTQPNPLNNNPLPFTTPIFLREIEGFIKTTVMATLAAPTYTPKNFSQQFEIRVTSKIAPAAKRIYIYSTETKSWFYIALN
jgi:hypothetical protein